MGRWAGNPWVEGALGEGSNAQLGLYDPITRTICVVRRWVVRGWRGFWASSFIFYGLDNTTI